MFENIKNVLLRESSVSTPEATTLYTQADDGTFQEKMDISYAPGTVFYIKNPDGAFEPEISDTPYEPSHTSEMTEGFMVATAIQFLQAHGYTATSADETRPVTPLADSIEISLALDQLRSMAGSHVQSRATIDDMYDVIEKIRAHL